MNGYPERKMWPCRDCREVGAFHCTDPERCGGTCEYVRADLVAERDAKKSELLSFMVKANDAMNKACDEKDARIEFLEKALEQAAEVVVRLGRDIYPDVTNQRYTCFDEWDDDNQCWGCGYTESPELAAYLREREGKEEAV